MTVIPNAPITSAATLYNPHEQSKEELIDNFVVRHNVFRKLFQEIKSAPMKHPEQHYIIEGQRGMGKTTLLLRLSYEIENDKALNSRLIPVVLKEEAHYGITRLFRLWETVALELGSRNTVFADLHSRMEKVYNEDEDYERKCFSILNRALERHALKMLLFIDNIGEMFNNFDEMECHRLREILMTCPNIRIIGASALVLEAFFKYDHAFYEFFKKEYLSGLNSEETRRLLSQLARAYQKQQAIRTIIAKQPQRVETLRILTGGVIRTIILLFEIFTDDQNGNAIRDLDKVLDKVTPLYKHRMDDLTPLQREIVNAVALNWDAVGIDEITRITRRKIDEITPVISELQKSFIIRRVSADTRSDLFHLQERFFNIWYLMRLGAKGCRTKVLWLVRFLESWYESDELVTRAQKHIRAISKGDYQPKAAYYFTEALARTGMLDLDTEHELIRATERFLIKKDKSLAAVLLPSDKKLLEKWWKHIKNKEYQKSLNVLAEIKNQEEIYFEYGGTYFKLKNYGKAEKYWLMAVDKDHADAMYNLGILYAKKLKNYETAEKYLLMAVDKGDADAMNNLGILYTKKLKNYGKAEKYWLMAVDKDHAEVMNNLGILYADKLKNYAKAEKYWLMAVDKDDADAMKNLGILYKDKLKNYGKAEKYYLMAGNKGNATAINDLAWMLCEQKMRKKDALKYILKAIDQSGEDIYNRYNLSWIYLWHNQIRLALKLADKIIVDQEMIEHFPKQYSKFIMFLLAKKQRQYVAKYFKIPDLQLMDRFKPLYYAFLKITGDENLNKMPPELSEPVNEIIAKIRQIEIDYA